MSATQNVLESERELPVPSKPRRNAAHRIFYSPSLAARDDAPFDQNRLFIGLSSSFSERRAIINNQQAPELSASRRYTNTPSGVFIFLVLSGGMIGVYWKLS
jgi:hypothetical protein